VWEEVRKLTGDTGAREIVAAHPEWVEEIAVDEEVPLDVDEATDLHRLR
jgi:CTP:molybdopterin cytidylyltransferase MocA